MFVFSKMVLPFLPIKPLSFCMHGILPLHFDPSPSKHYAIKTITIYYLHCFSSSLVLSNATHKSLRDENCKLYVVLIIVIIMQIKASPLFTLSFSSSLILLIVCYWYKFNRWKLQITSTFDYYYTSINIYNKSYIYIYIYIYIPKLKKY